MKSCQPPVPSPRSPAPSSQPPPLTRIIPWGHQLLCEVLQPGDLAVDLTAGKGRDTLVLAEAVGPSGQVVAFDVQKTAIEQAEAFLAEKGVVTKRHDSEQTLPGHTGVYLVHGCHSMLKDIVTRPAKGIIANLGYLPGSDQTVMTQPETTLGALNHSIGLLAPGGRFAVTVYPAHEGGSDEAAVVDHFFASLPHAEWHVLLLRTANRPDAPYLYVAEGTG